MMLVSLGGDAVILLHTYGTLFLPNQTSLFLLFGAKDFNAKCVTSSTFLSVP